MNQPTFIDLESSALRVEWIKAITFNTKKCAVIAWSDESVTELTQSDSSHLYDFIASNPSLSIPIFWF